MSTEYSLFAKPTFSAADFQRDAPAINTLDEQLLNTEPRTSAVQNPREPTPMQDGPGFAGTTIYAGSAKAKSAGRSIRPALMVGVPAVVLAAGVAYFAMQPRQTIVADPVPATAVVEPLTATPAPTELASLEASPPAVTQAAAISAAKPAPAARTEAPARVARARVAPTADDATSFAADASVTSPAAPIPYSALGQTSAPAPAAIMVPPMIRSPAPAETTPAPTMTPEPSVQDPATPALEAPEPATP